MAALEELTRDVRNRERDGDDGDNDHQRIERDRGAESHVEIVGSSHRQLRERPQSSAQPRCQYRSADRPQGRID